MGLLSLKEDYMGKCSPAEKPASEEEKERLFSERKLVHLKWDEEEELERKRKKELQTRLAGLRAKFDPNRFVEFVRKAAKKDIDDGGFGRVHPTAAMNDQGLGGTDEATDLLFKERPWRVCKELVTVSGNRLAIK